MKILCIVLLVLVLLALLPLGGSIRYDQSGFFAFLKLGPLWLRLYPPTRDKKEKKPKEKREKSKKEPPKAREDHPKGGPLDLVKSALPLIRPALSGLKKRLTVETLDLQVTWAADDPADAALGFGCANAALGILWALVSENFKVKDHRLGCDVDFNAAAPQVYLDAALTLNLWKALTLVLPLLFRFVRNYSALKGKQQETVKKEA